MKARELVDAVDTPGGHIIISIAIGTMGVAVAVVAHWYGHDMVAAAVAPMTGFFQVAAYAMRGTDKANAQTTTSTSVRSESPAEPVKDKETKS